MRHIIYTTLAAALTSIVSLQAGDTNKDTSKTVMPKEVAATPAVTKHDWALELGTGVALSNVRDSNLDGYTAIPAKLTAVYTIDEVSLDKVLCGVLRGNTEFLFQGYWDEFVHAPRGENHIEGMNFGPRYNFVQPGWKFVPYVQGLVGFGFADSNPTGSRAAKTSHGLGQDFNFTFGVGAGVRYDICQNWYTQLGVDYSHFSNAGLSGSVSNRAIDQLGPQVSLGYRF